MPAFWKISSIGKFDLPSLGFYTGASSKSFLVFQEHHSFLKCYSVERSTKELAMAQRR